MKQILPSELFGGIIIKEKQKGKDVKSWEKVNTGKMAAQTAYLLGAKQKKEAIGIEHDPFGVLATDRYLYQNGKDQIRKGGVRKNSFDRMGKKQKKQTILSL